MELGDSTRHDRAVSRVEGSSESLGDVQRRTHWWRVGYKRLATVIAFVGVVFGLAQLPGRLEGLPGDLKRALNVIDTRTHPDSVVAFDRIGPFRLEPDRSLKAAVAALGKPTAIDKRGGSCFVRWEQKGIYAQFVASFGTPCAPQYGFLCAAELTGSHWKTDSGLRVDVSIGRLRSLYPSVESTGPINSQSWRLEKGTGGCPNAVIAPEASRGGYAVTAVERVDRFELNYLTRAE